MDICGIFKYRNTLHTSAQRPKRSNCLPFGRARERMGALLKAVMMDARTSCLLLTVRTPMEIWRSLRGGGYGASQSEVSGRGADSKV